MRTSAIAVGALFGCCTSLALAQSCAAPGSIPAIPFTTFGDTCSGGAIDEFGAVCGGGIISPGPSDVYQFTMGPASYYLFSVTPSGGYDTALYLVGPGPCAQTTACPTGGDADIAGPNGTEFVQISAPASGTYFVVIDSTSPGSTAPACGAYTLQVLSSLEPVELRNFSVD